MDNHDNNTNECPVCFCQEMMSTKYYTCSHYICDQCNHQWNKHTCPLCRAPETPTTFITNRNRNINPYELESDLELAPSDHKHIYNNFLPCITQDFPQCRFVGYKNSTTRIDCFYLRFEIESLRTTRYIQSTFRTTYSLPDYRMDYVSWNLESDNVLVGFIRV